MRIFLTLLFTLALAVFAAHASGCADIADYQHTDECQICHFAERNDDASPPPEFCHAAPASIASQLSLSAIDAVTEKAVVSANSRAPPLQLNEK